VTRNLNETRSSRRRRRRLRRRRRRVGDENI